MTWVRFEDRFPWHRKVRPLSDAAFRLHVSGICWSTEHLTDGFVPAEDLGIVSDVRTPTRYLQELVFRGLWLEVEGGWEINDYLAYNQSAQQVRASREAAAERQRRAREAATARRESQGQSRRDSRSSSDDEAVPPSRPVPSPESPSDSRSRDALPDRFSDFWAAYPKRVGRGQAIKAWKAAVKKADPDTIIAGAESYAATVTRTETETRFIAHPSTWLNGERWADERPVLRAVSGSPSWKMGDWDV